MKHPKLLHWHKLDNSAKIFPMLVTKRTQSMFRSTWDLEVEINPDILLNALKNTLVRFPSFKVKIKRGIFWYYLEENTAEPRVYSMVPGGIRKITNTNCDGYCFRISYYKNNLYADFYHVLCDGKSAIEFLKCLVYYYLKLANEDVYPENCVMTLDTPVDPDELQDGFLKHYKPLKLKDLKIKDLQGQKAFILKGELFADSCGLINMYCDVKQILQVAKNNNCSLTVLLTALFILSIYDTKIKGKDIDEVNHNIQIFLPINLRAIFPSKTLYNFSLFSRVPSDTKTDMSLETLIPKIRDSIDFDKDKDRLSGKISTTVTAEKFFLMRIMPLPIKQLIVNISNNFFGKAKKTATLSSLGIINLPKSMEPFINRITLNVCPNDKAPLSFTCVTCKQTLSISFARRLIDTEIEKRFAEYLTSYGVDLKITSNFWEVE